MAKKIVSTLDKAAGKICGAMQWLCVVILFGMMLLGTGDVLGRYLLNKPITGTYETFGFLLPALVLLGLGYTQAARAHVRIELVITRMPPRLRNAVGIFTTVIALGIACLIFWQGLGLSIKYWHLGKMIDTIHLPIYIPQLVVPIGALALSFVLLVQLLEYITGQAQRS
ncbi:MAG TPA: TRAP transporter small permease [Dehalococcoidales bacterium]|nr:MAG: hypothetical protein A2Z05_04675 [Chloroflexi bacterium RBG_16_60_22]HJX12427.1 TRAP transporter small permease [Dehalococcoidales bacterium]